ncbi:hypothetical protein CVD28_02855 [Bacillus sp. M6-12]|uniref:hypothetical protein n=1 Tax=Bacillus sp. M6-12 TaxID=2054166 RepID=UPI000C77C763|nr:hypothetical protein [Bacillus sp. M6-12]PLS19371.1 hypothetical protein CVD28_02855 [Bacillus sp. M6-12]
MTRDEARAYFKNKGLTYQDIKEGDINRLVTLLGESLEDYRLHGGEHAESMGMTIRKPRVRDVKILKRTGFQYAYLRVKGSYFEGREAISFNRDGFIGFGGELDSKNIAPIIKAFCKWCDSLTPLSI